MGKKGSSKVIIKIENQLAYTSPNISYNTKLPTNENSLWSFTKRVLNADSHDNLQVKLELKDNEGSPVIIKDPTDVKVSKSLDATISQLEVSQDTITFKVVSGYEQGALDLELNIKNKIIKTDSVSINLNEKYTFDPDYKSIGTVTYIKGISSPIDEMKRITGYNFDNTAMYQDQKSKTFIDGGEGRSFSFDQTQQTFQQLHLDVTDTPTEFLSHMMHSHLYFFPRKQLFQAKPIDKETALLTLPTGEMLIMQSKDSEIISGALKECSPIHMGENISRHKRDWAQINYQGKGLVIRVNARGQFPELSNWNKNKIRAAEENAQVIDGYDCIDNTGYIGAEGVYIYNGSTKEVCTRTKKEFWTKTSEGGYIFKFPKDEQLDQYLQEKCNFGIPKI
jgi:hypothetical protein